MKEDTLKAEDATTAEVTSPGAGMQLFGFIETLLLSLWLGAMVFFSFAVAPSAFAVLQSRHLAGLIVAGTLKDRKSVV